MKAVSLLDHEVAHFGDPAFDLGFSLTHLLSKALHLEAYRPLFLAAALSTGKPTRPKSTRPPGLKALRAVRQKHCRLPACPNGGAIAS